MANSNEQTSKPLRTEKQQAAAAAMVKATAERRAKQAALKAAGGTHITREDTMRPKSWMPAQMLPEPDRQPGYEYRYIRISTLNQADPSNVSAKLREGWEPVKIEEQPQMQFLVNPNSRYKDSIEIGGLILCKTPTEFVNQRTAHFEQQTQAQTDAVDHNMMRQSDPRMPMFRERDSRTSFGKR